MFSLISSSTNDWANNLDAGDLRRHRAHYDDTIMPQGMHNPVGTILISTFAYKFPFKNKFPWITNMCSNVFVNTASVTLVFSTPYYHYWLWLEVPFPCHYCDVIMGAMASHITSLTIVYSTVYSGADQRKHQSSASLAFVRGIHRWPVKFPAQMASNAENVSIWWRHHEVDKYMLIIFWLWICVQLVMFEFCRY